MQLDLEAAAALVRADGLYDPEDVAQTESDDVRFADIGVHTATVIYPICSLEQNNEADTVTRAHFYGFWDSDGDFPSPIHIRDIRLGQGREDVMAALGFTPEDIAAVGDQTVLVTRLQGGDEATWAQLDLVPEGATLAVQQTEQGTVGWVTTLSPAEDGEGGVQFGFRDGSTGEYTNSVQLAFYGGVLNQATVYGV